jgi:hypothetical protein
VSATGSIAIDFGNFGDPAVRGRDADQDAGCATWARCWWQAACGMHGGQAGSPVTHRTGRQRAVDEPSPRRPTAFCTTAVRSPSSP